MKRVVPLHSEAKPGFSRQESKNARILLRIMVYSTALAFGFAFGWAESLRSGPTGFWFKLSPWTLACATAGFLATLLFWRAVVNGPKARRRGAIALIVAGLGLFLYPLRFVPSTQLPKIALGLGVAALVISTLGFIFWPMTRFLEEETREMEAKQNQSAALRDSKSTNR